MWNIVEKNGNVELEGGGERKIEEGILEYAGNVYDESKKN